MKVISKDSDIRIATEWGAILVLEAGTEFELSDEIGHLALSNGAKLVEQTKKVTVKEVVPELKEEVVAVVAPDPMVATVTQICTDIIDEGDPKNFNIDGSPKAKVINDRIGAKIPSGIREQAWEQALNA
jgi:hypothetical protein